MSTSRAAGSASVVPAQLSFLTIYNPSFGDTDETAYDQIVYFHEKRDNVGQSRYGDGKTQTGGPASKDADQSHRQDYERNERLRKVGLARGMVEFAK